MVNVNKTLVFLAAAVAVSAGVIEKRQGSYGHGCIPNVTNNGKYNAWCS
ncbi:hypothetical protein PTRG_09458 [Pyrenophora tritici-repentis Pt-1C-BFP]|uniref:Uncharacterized protein n=1 Tax=Pyrenophora tritici-repentis (strain Pt-1C-BFP) TaxID=426418 RepID=B2WHJ9_PYRTR|nr:uncharacterized protein PTRG_09458 [Pyrenophora tritici-repentis Pt-1C-BFP]EDU42509.1 hypothetical protein PTRG_09458 [Pyrenophora tritici-repentis Pt-1C-BFP]